MEASADTIFSLAQKRLDWLQNRQGVLAQNVANADTPNYRPRDLTPFGSILSAAVTPVVTSPMHISSGAASTSTVTTAGSGRAPDGNQVSLEAELTKVAQTDGQQRLVSNIYSKYMSMFSMALGRG